MEVFHTYIYEIKKGTKPLALMTIDKSKLKIMLAQIIKQRLSYFVTFLENGKVNLFFGHRDVVEIVRRLFCKPLSDLTVEEDFILGTFLGYSLTERVKRYKKLSLAKDKKAMKKIS